MRPALETSTRDAKSDITQQTEGRRRAVVENVRPQIDGGRFPIKRIPGETVEVFADIHADGHDMLSAVLRFRRQGSAQWEETPMLDMVNDLWTGEFTVRQLGRYEYTVEAWVDHFKTWRRDLKKKFDANQDLKVDLLIGVELLRDAASRAHGDDARLLHAVAASLHAQDQEQSALVQQALADEVLLTVSRYPDRRFATTFERTLTVEVDRERARFSAWYELFPRSTSKVPGRHGTFRDVEDWLPYVAGMGFDILYFPPIHPIGRQFRKGRNNALDAAPDDPGSPWAIGGPEGGHKAIHPELGTLDDFRRLVKAAHAHGLEIALDLAHQCSPDHPYVREHPQWFKQRPDGTIQYAENPPKKYQDIYPFDFETADWQAMWQELKSVVDYWIEQGVKIFRVDNPHTKAYGFWEWMIAAVKREHPDVIFLAEAFTRPKIMARLAKLGFTQSYTYFTWRNTKPELTEYMTELTKSELFQYFRPNFWPNTPDILHEALQTGGRAAFMVRQILAATMSSNYGIYGPAFELMDHVPFPGKEEYVDNEKYEIKRWEIDRPDSLRPLITTVNRIRRENPALHANAGFNFHHVDNDHLIAYSKATEGFSNVILTIVNLHFQWKQSGFTWLQMPALGLDEHETFDVHDLLTGARYTWSGPRNYVELHPTLIPAHILRIERRR